VARRRAVVRIALASVRASFGSRCNCGTTVTKHVYRHQLRPAVQTDATIMDQLFGRRKRGRLAVALCHSGDYGQESKRPNCPVWKMEPMSRTDGGC
jgi:hypothetical protein